MTAASVVIPTRDRPALLGRAVASALAQEVPGGIEVVVVDDDSTPPATVPDDPRVRLIRLHPARGGAAARNAGLAAASGHWVTFLDDDDELLPGMIRDSIEAAATSRLPPPVAALSTLEVVDAQGSAIALRKPPTLPRGAHWNLEPLPAGRSFLVKQSLVIERAVLQELGGFDESFRSRVHSEMFLRLNPACSLVGLDRPGYRLHRHGGPAVSGDPALRKASFRMLVGKHGAVLRRHPQAFAAMLLEHAGTCRRQGLAAEALRWAMRAARYDPAAAVRFMLSLARRRGRAGGPVPRPGT